MKQALIDIGSNSMRLTVYETDGSSFRILFKEKNMAGIAGYIDKGILSDAGIECACSGLREFRSTLESLDINNTHVFATASLRNIANTDAAVSTIEKATGYRPNVITGRQEALFGYEGAMHEVQATSGVFIDIGGTSTEIVIFAGGEAQTAASYKVGSLNLYRECVKKIIPGYASFKSINEMIRREIDDCNTTAYTRQSPLVCVGGTARAVLKIACRIYDLPDDSHSITSDQLLEIADILCRADKNAIDLILKLEPDRIHTMIPGIMILRHIQQIFSASEIIISRYGVREGYLCQKIICSSSDKALEQ